jgi:hypothetical protein
MALLAVVLADCDSTLDAGWTVHGALPVDKRNPIVLMNDSVLDNWQAEYAMLLANSDGPRLVGIVVNANSKAWPNLDDNLAGWTQLVADARSSGLQVPDPLPSRGVPLARPDSGQVDATLPIASDGAQFLISKSKEVSLPYRPLVVVTGGHLTDVAKAYLLDPTIVDRVVVVASLGSLTTSGGVMGSPNGDGDPWSSSIVAARFRFVQVSAYYDQTTDVPAQRTKDLPPNAFGNWVAGKQTSIWRWPPAADQVAVQAVWIPNFATVVEHVSSLGPIAAGATDGPELTIDANGPGYLVTQSASAVAIDRFWKLLLDRKTFGR